MRNYLCFIIASLLYVSCHKSDTLVKSDELVTSPASITITDVDNGVVLKTLIILPEYSADKNIHTIYLTDSEKIAQYEYAIYKIKRTIKTDPATGFIKSIDSRNYELKLVTITPNSIPIITYFAPTYQNYEVHRQERQSGFNLYSTLDLNLYSDSNHTMRSQNFTLNMEWDTILGKIQSFIRYSPSSESDLNIISSDSIFIQEYRGGGLSNAPGRYADFYRTDVPWYKYQPASFSYYNVRSPFVCDSFSIYNGNYDLSTGFMVPQLLWKKTYEYNSDTSQMKNILEIINPQTYDLLWVYIYHQIESNPAYYYYFDDEDFYSIYNLMCTRSKDSVFAMSNGTKQLKQTATLANAVQKDDKGRIVKITQNMSNRGFVRVYDITY